MAQRTNGAEIGNLERLSFLQKKGWEVQIHSAIDETSKDWAQKFLAQENSPLNPKNSTYQLDGIPVEIGFGKGFHDEKITSEAPMLKHFAEIIEKYQPDYIWTNYYDYFAVSAANLWKPERSWVDVSDNQIPRLEAFKKLDPLPRVREAYLKIENLMVASPFMKRVCERDFPSSVRVLEVPNPIRFPPNAAASGWDFQKPWLFVNPTEVKGAPFVLEMAKALPHEKFLFVLNWIDQKRPEGLPLNVECIPRQSSLDPIFPKVKGILVPSIVEEGLGRVALEAMAAGVPVIASDRGALPETVGIGGVCLPLELNKWTSVLQNKDFSYWSSLTEKGFTRVKEYEESSSTQLGRIELELQKGL